MKRKERRRKRNETGTQEHPLSEGNLGFADESLDVLQEPKAKPLAPATGIIVGIGLSIMLWSFIILMSFIIVIVFWI